MSEDNDVRAELDILSTSRTPDSIVRHLGLAPDAKLHMGESILGTLIKSKHHAVTYRSSLERGASVEDHVDNVVAKLWPIADRIASLPSDCSKELAVVCYCSDRIAIHISAKAIKFLSEIGAEIDIDYYYFPRSDEGA